MAVSKAISSRVETPGGSEIAAMRDSGRFHVSGTRPDVPIRKGAEAGIDPPRPVAVPLVRISSGAGYSASPPRAFSHAEQRASRAKLLGLFAVMTAIWAGIQALRFIAG